MGDAQDPWSIPANLSPDAPYQTKKAEERTAAKKSHKKSKKQAPKVVLEGLADWNALPAKEGIWIKGLLDNCGDSTLEVHPCMEENLLLPLEVFDILNAGRGKVNFYAYVRNPLLCPRHLCYGKLVHQHRCNNNLVAVCITQDMPSGVAKAEPLKIVRCFVRCFSAKCEVMPLLALLIIQGS